MPEKKQRVLKLGELIGKLAMLDPNKALDVWVGIRQNTARMRNPKIRLAEGTKKTWVVIDSEEMRIMLFSDRKE